MEYLDNYTVGESDEVYILFPKNIDTDYEKILSIDSITKSPIK